MTELTKTEPRALTPYGEALKKKIERTYVSDYPTKPAAANMEVLADTRNAIPTLYQIAQLKGQTYTNALITKCITSIITKHVHVIRGMDRNMAAATAELITERYKLMNPADVKFFITKGIMGEYGKILDRVDGALIMQWAHDYWEQMKYLIRLRQKNDEKDDPGVPAPEEIQKLSEQLRIKEAEKKSREVLQPEHRKTLAEEYAARGWDLDEINSTP